MPILWITLTDKPPQRPLLFEQVHQGRAAQAAKIEHAMTAPDDAGQWLTTSQAAARMGVSERTVRRRCQSGVLPARLDTTEDGQQWFIDPSGFEGADTADTTAANDDRTVRSPWNQAADTQNDEVQPTGADTADTTADTLRDELIEQLRGENLFLRESLERAQQALLREQQAHAESRQLQARVMESLPAPGAAESTPMTQSTAAAGSVSQGAAQKAAPPLSRAEAFRQALAIFFGLKR